MKIILNFINSKKQNKSATFAAVPYKLLAIIALSLLIVPVGCAQSPSDQPADEYHKAIDSFKSCVAAGNPVTRSLPAQCSANGEVFVDAIEVPNLIKENGPTCKDNCGNGKCEEIVCMAIGCPCAESVQSCPEDCD